MNEMDFYIVFLPDVKLLDIYQDRIIVCAKSMILFYELIKISQEKRRSRAFFLLYNFLAYRKIISGKIATFFCGKPLGLFPIAKSPSNRGAFR